MFKKDYIKKIMLQDMRHFFIFAYGSLYAINALFTFYCDFLKSILSQ